MTKTNVPRLRFREFSGEWKMGHLSDIGTVKMNKRIHKKDTKMVGEVPFFKIGTFGKKPDAFIDRDKFIELKKRYPYPSKGDILISASGTLGRTVVYDGSDEYFQDSNIIWLDLNKKTMINSFLLQFYKQHVWNSEGTTIKRLYNKDIYNTEVNYPFINEQQKIGDFFAKQDKLIELQTQKVDQLKKLKRGYLQKMFPQEGEAVPRLRFSGFSGEWKEEKANDIFINESIKNHGYEEVLAATQDNGIVYRKDLDIDIKFDKTTLNKYKYVIPGNIIISLRSFQGGFEVSNKKGIISPAYTIMSFKDSENNINYWKQYLKTYKFIQSLKKVTFGIRDGRSISFKEFSTLKLKFTENKNEQQKIGDFFAKLDKLIEEQSVKLDQLKQQKKAYLQKMFI